MKWFLKYSYLEFQQDFVKICNCFQNCSIFFVLFCFNDHYWPTKRFRSRRWVTWQNFSIQNNPKNGFKLFLLRVENCFNFAFISFFYMICLLTRFETRSCRVESHHGIYSYPFFSLSVGVSFLLVTFYLSRSLSLSLLIPHFSCCYVA